MCGIIGQVNFQGRAIEEDFFNSYRDTLTHRGPDGSGTRLLLNNTVAFGHRRLSIIDLSNNGVQPMTNENESVWLTFNGEIYNFLSLRKELLDRGHTFNSNTDSEVIIHGYEEWGIESLLEKLQGMFAFAIYDLNTRSLFLARDRFGIKPLFYSNQKDTFMFASEIKAIKANNNLDFTLDLDALCDFLVYRFIPPPSSIWKEVKKLAPGNFLKVNSDARLEIKQYYSLKTAANLVTSNEAEEMSEFLLKSAVQSHLISDVPVGVFLSGGYDSTVVASMMHSLNVQVRSFTIGFEGWNKSEHLDADEVAGLFSNEHKFKIVNDDLLEKLGMLSYFYDEPLGGSSFLPTYEVSKFAAESVKVVLSGDGGDEVFAGYKWHDAIYQKFNNEGLLNKLTNRIHGKSKIILDNYWKLLSWSDFSFNEISGLLNDTQQKRALTSKDDLWFYKRHLETSFGPVRAFQMLDFHSFLPEVVLTKVDRASMANSLEVRVPFLDHKLVEYALSLDSNLVYSKGVNKRILNTYLKSRVSSQILNKPKQGFGAPIRKGDGMKKQIADLADSKLVNSGIFNNKKITEDYINKGKSKQLWSLIILSHWMDRWL